MRESKPLVLITRMRPSEYEYHYDATSGTITRKRIPAEPLTQYAFKWFRVDDDKGKLIGSYRGAFIYKKGWQKPEENPSLCRNGYHVLNSNALEMNIGHELWIVQVRGVVEGRDKSVAENVRPVVRVCTQEEWYAANEALVKRLGQVLPEYKYWEHQKEDSFQTRKALDTLARNARQYARNRVPLLVLQSLVEQALGHSRLDLRLALDRWIASNR